MLLNKLFFIDSLENINDSILCAIHVNEENPIFMGHFPGQPVLPGVCMLEMLKEVLQYANHQRYQLASATSVKFLTMFAPPHFTKAVFEIKAVSIGEDKLSVNAILKFEQHIFLKFAGVYNINQQ